MCSEVFWIESLGIPCHVQEEGDRIFHRLQVSYIHYPESVHSVFVCEVHLLPYAWYRIDVHPLGVARSANIVEVVVHSIAALPLRCVQLRHPADIAPVVIAEKQGHIVRNLHSVIIVVLYLLI